MSNKTSLLALIIALIALAVAVVRPDGKSVIDPSPKKETAFERVMRTGTIRCGYGVFAPYLMKDAATGEFSGIWHDLTEAVAAHLALKVVWAEEVPLGDIGAALNSGRVDAYCSGLWTAGKRVRVVDYLSAPAYEPLLVYIRADDHRFDSDLGAINSPDVRISTIDGEGGGLVAGEEFPKAKLVSLPQLSGYADMFNQVVTNKADALLAAPGGAEEFMKNNPGVLHPLNKPVRIFPITSAIKYGENALRDMLDQAQDDVILNGVMDKILTKYEPFPGAILRVAPPYISSAKP